MSIRTFVLALTALAAISSAVAQTTTAATTRQLSFPAMGLGSTETAQISVVNVAANSSSGTAASCTGTISFVNANGATIGTATPFTVTSGQIFSARLAFVAAGAAGIRTDIRGVVQITESSATPRPPCSLESSFATYDTTTGATHAIVTGSGGPGGPGSGFRN